MFDDTLFVLVVCAYDAVTAVAGAGLPRDQAGEGESERRFPGERSKRSPGLVLLPLSLHELLQQRVCMDEREREEENL